MSNLEWLQVWLQDIFFDPAGVEHGVKHTAAKTKPRVTLQNLDEVVESRRGLSATKRLQIYAGMIQRRLKEAVAMDFPATQRVLGEDAEPLLCDFVAEHPSTHRSLNLYGREFPEYVAGRLSGRPECRFLVELAQFERILVEVHHEQEVSPLRPDDFASIGDQLAACRFECVPAFRLLACKFPCLDFRRQAEQAAPETVLPLPAERAQWILVHRYQNQIFRRELSKSQFLILQALSHGDALEAALAEALDASAEETGALVAALPGWFQEWSSYGIFAGVSGFSQSRGTASE